MCGFNLKNFIEYVLIQMGVVFMTVVSMTLLLGTILIFMMNHFIYSYLMIGHSVFEIPLFVYLISTVAVIILIVVTVILIIGHLHQSNIHLLSQQQSFKRMISFVGNCRIFIFLVLYIFSICSVAVM